MTQGIPTKVIAASIALTAFAIAVVAGVSAGNSAEAVLARALLAMLVLYVTGTIAGFVCERTIREGAEAYKRATPVPPEGVMPGAAPAGQGGQGSTRSVTTR